MDMHTIIISSIFIMIYSIGIYLSKDKPINMFLMFSCISFFTILLYAELEAYDVAITEAVLSGGLCGFFFFLNYALYSLSDMSQNSKDIDIKNKIDVTEADISIFKSNSERIGMMVTFLACVLFGLILFYAIFESSINTLNGYQSINCNDIMYPVNNHNIYICYNYIQNPPIKIKSLISGILAGYRGFDTMCETLVISIVAIGCYSLQKNLYKKN